MTETLGGFDGIGVGAQQQRVTRVARRIVRWSRCVAWDEYRGSAHACTVAQVFGAMAIDT